MYLRCTQKAKANSEKKNELNQWLLLGLQRRQELNKNDGVYYVVDHVTDKAEATHFVPVKTADAQGRIIVKGLEDDTYTLTEVRTDSGYVMLKQGIDVVISQKNTNAS